MKKLVTFGDSFTYGEELADVTSAWPQQLANSLSMELLNYGEPGTCNDSMLRKLLEFFSSPHENNNIGLVVIAWSNPGRVEFADNLGNFSIWPGARADKFKLAEPWREELIDYNSSYHNTKWLCQRYINNVILAQRFLKDTGIPYIMLDIMHYEYYKRTHLTDFTPLCSLVDTSTYLGWGESGMAEMVGRRVPRGKGGHFLEEGHRIVAEKIYKFYENNMPT